MFKPAVKTMPIQDIRADTDSFQKLILFSLNRIHIQTFDSVKAEEFDQLVALEASIGMIDSFLGPYYGEEYRLIVEKIEKEIENAYNRGERQEYIRNLRKWVKEITKRLSSPGVGILPAVSASYVAGKGRGTPDEL